MEAPTTTPAETIRIPEDEGTWRAHVKYAEGFRGSNAEYCRRNRIDHRVFRSYKKKFGATKARAADLKAFVKIQAESQGEPKAEMKLDLRTSSLFIFCIHRRTHLKIPIWTCRIRSAGRCLKISKSTSCQPTKRSLASRIVGMVKPSKRRLNTLTRSLTTKR